MVKQSFYLFFLGTFLWSAVYAAQPTRQGCDFGDEGHAEFCNILTNCIQAVNLNIFDDAFVGGNLEVVGNVILTDTTPVSCTAPCQTGITGITGALVVAGGVFIGENLHVCGPINTNTEYDIECKRVLDATGTNLAVGFDALNNLDTGGTQNTAVGREALQNNIGNDNTAVGYQALQLNQNGINNTAIGSRALTLNATGNRNTAVGCQALRDNIVNDNTALGHLALGANATGIFNTALGVVALEFNISGHDNTAVGANALRTNLTGNSNTAVGSQALYYNNSNFNAALGLGALGFNVTGTNNTAVGFLAGVNILGSDNIDIGNQGDALDNGTIRIGASGIQTTAYLQGVYGVTPAGAPLPVIIDADGQLGTTDALTVTQLFITGATPVACVSPCISGASGVTGALVVAGGVYVGENLHVCGPINTNTHYDIGCERVLDATGTNLAVGFDALNNLDTITSLQNTAVGNEALRDNIGYDNNALGFQALQRNQDGFHNVAIGTQALQNNTGGNYNVAVGDQALQLNTVGEANTAIGDASLATNVIGSFNTAVGSQALYFNNSNFNTALGIVALLNNVTGTNNTAVGSAALINNVTGTNNTAVGALAGTNIVGSDNIDIGNDGLASDNGAIRIGASGIHTTAFIQGIDGVPVGGNAVFVSSAGQLGLFASSKRFKKNIETMSEQIYKLLQLRPVEFVLVNDPEERKQYGLIAEEVNEVYPEMVTHDAQGNIFSVNYMALIPVLLKQIQEQQNQIALQEARIGALENA